MHLMWSDNGSNFVSAIMSFEKPPKWWQYLQTHRVDWITWVSTTNEALQTLVIEVKTGVDLRPVTAEIINDVQSHDTLFPSNLQSMKSKVVVPPPGSLGPADTYCCKCWRRTQHIMNKFWPRWCKELIKMQLKQKLCRGEWRIVQKGGIVLLKGNSNQNHQPISLKIKMFSDI